MPRDVTLRDGLQDERVVATDDKVALFDALVRAGVRDLELTSFVRPDRVPAMADAPELAARTAGRRRRALGARAQRRAAPSGPSTPGSTGCSSSSASPTPTASRNAGRTTDAGLAELEAIAATLPDGARIEVTLATAFGCPYDGPVAPAAVLAAAERALAAGASAVSLADTIGTAIPKEVTGLVTATSPWPASDPSACTSTTPAASASTNALDGDRGRRRRASTAASARSAAARSRPGASGNLALEDLVHVLEESGVDTGIDLDALIDAARRWPASSSGGRSRATSARPAPASATARVRVTSS